MHFLPEFQCNIEKTNFICNSRNMNYDRNSTSNIYPTYGCLFLKILMNLSPWLTVRFTSPVPFHDFTLFVALSPFSGGSPNACRKYSACVGGTVHEKRGQHITQNHKMGQA